MIFIDKNNKIHYGIVNPSEKISKFFDSIQMRYPDLIPKDRPGLSFANLATRINKAHATFQANSDANLLRTLGAQLAKNAARSRLVSSISTTAKVPS